MTRRPCSIALTSDDATILCADKFGDVYSLPLLPSPDYQPPEVPAVEPEQETFVPSATVLTVHSGRNRKTLEDQLKQATKGPAPPKDVMKFEHQLLLGHVSMLTDIVNAQVGTRSYILTADRDEHIRVSRGVPQAHIIEGFCFGHEAFISKLCMTQSGLLVSGGGDAELLVWDWQNYKLVEKLPIRDVALNHLKSRPELGLAIEDESFKVAVSGIWDVSRGNGEVCIDEERNFAFADSQQTNEILVACEGVPALFSFKIGVSATSGAALALNGNALDVAVVQSSQASVVVAIDHVYKPGSTKETREDSVSCCCRLAALYMLT
jgi:tRNA (guanine-N(7)-)-methyltransferase subunit TRM82